MKTFVSSLNITCLLLFILISSCKHDNSIILKGDIKGLNTKWIYLHNNYPVGSPPIDSAKVIKGKFEFTFHPDTVFQPNLVFLTYFDNKKHGQGLGIINPYENKAKGLSLYSGFIMEPGITMLTGDLLKSTGITINGGKQNEFYFKNIDLPFIRISKDFVKRHAQAERIKKLINQYPDAYWAFFTLSNSKYYFNNLQLKNIYNEFSINIKQSYNGKKLKQFIDGQPKSREDFPNSVLVDASNKHTYLIDTSKKLNIVVFWASWCGPCRMEIPSLKRIASKVVSKDLRMVSVSIDNEKDKWLKAVNEEQMPWQQLIIQPEKKELAVAQYNLGWVPQIYLVNNKNKVVSKIDGFDDENEEKVKAFIIQYLSKN